MKDILPIRIPKGKKPVRTDTDHSTIIEWVDDPSLKSFYSYAREYAEDQAVPLPETVAKWSYQHKMGLLMKIAHSLNNGIQLDWMNTAQPKCCLFYDSIFCKLSFSIHYVTKHVNVYFTDQAVNLALKIIPPDFIKTL